MRAVHVTSLQGPDALTLVDLPEPQAGAGGVVIDVRAAGVAFPDLLLTRGLYQLKPALPFSPGGEVAGVVRVAPEGSGFAVGDRVAAFTMIGGWAEVVIAPVEHVFPLPDTVSFVQGAGLVLNYLTVLFALQHRGRLAPGETVLVHGAGGGVGVAALQLAPVLGAGRTIAVVADEGKAQVARAAGATDVVLTDGWAAAVHGLTDGGGVDVVLDPVGGDRFLDSIRSLKAQGRLLIVGFASGEIPTVAANRLLLRNVDLVGVSWGAYALAHPGYLRRQWEVLAPMVADGRVRPVEGPTWPMERAADALLSLERREAVAKVVLTLT